MDTDLVPGPGVESPSASDVDRPDVDAIAARWIEGLDRDHSPEQLDLMREAVRLAV